MEQNSTLVKVIENATDFSEYKRFVFNRQVKTVNVTSLIKSFRRFGTAGTKVTVLETKAFSNRKEYYIADGHHSVVAATACGLGLNVTIIKLKNDTPKEVAQYVSVLNNARVSWSNNNFLNMYVGLSVPEYITFNNAMIRTRLGVTDLLYIFLNGGGAHENSLYKNGLMTFPDEANSLLLLEAVKRVKNLIPNKAYLRRSLYKVMRMTCDFDRIADAIIESGIEFSHDEAILYDQLVKIYKKEFKN